MPTGVAAAPAAPLTDRKVIATEAAAFTERTRNSKKHKTYMSYKEAVEFFLATCKKKYLDELTRDDMITLKQVLRSKYASETVFPMWMKVNTFLNVIDHLNPYFLERSPNAVPAR